MEARYKEPFGSMAEELSCPNWLPLIDELQKWIVEELPVTAPEIPLHILPKRKPSQDNLASAPTEQEVLA